MAGFPESKLEWLIDKFGDYVGWFNASKIRDRGDKSYKNNDWKILMDLAVERGHAYSSDSYPNAPKDSIAFNLPEIPKFFDDYIFECPDFIDMPTRLLWETEFFTNFLEFFRACRKWDKVYNLLCGLQYHGIFDDKLLEEDLPDECKKFFVCEASRANASKFHIE